MQMMRVGDYRPDVSDLYGKHTRTLLNVLPRGDGYGPMNDHVPFTDALPATCRGAFFARKSDGTIAVFAGTATKLYLLDNTTLSWSDVSKSGGTYSSLNSDAQWRFAQFNNFVFATQKNDALQVYDLTSSSEFADLGGSPPQAGWIAVINRFLVLCDLSSNPYRVQWSGLNATTTWSSGVNSSDSQDLPDGGRPLATAGGEVGIVLQENGLRRMIFAPGSLEVFQIDRPNPDQAIGILSPNSLVQAGGRIFFLSSQGFVQTDVSCAVKQIGKERVDRTFLADYDSAEPQLVIGANDPKFSRVFWSYKSGAVGEATQFDKLLCYDYALDRWAPIDMTGTYLAPISRPGLTLENLDAIAPGAQTISDADDNGSGLIRLTVGSTSEWTTDEYKTVSGVGGTTEANGTWQITVVDGTHIDLQDSSFSNAYTSGGVVGGSLDALTFSLDDVSTATLPELALFDEDDKLGFFNGDALEATVETSEQSIPGYRMEINGVRPISDASSVFASISKRDNLNAAVSYGDESAIDDDGYCPVLEETRFARAKLRIPAAETWTFVTGVEPDAMRAGEF